jgi:V8-like Glu-specific endopeptidase
MFVLLLTLTVFGLSPLLSAAPPIVYGDDDRIEAIESARWYRESQAVAGRYEKHSFKMAERGIELKGETLAQRLFPAYNAELCVDEPFRDQPALPTCTGFLVTPTLLVTAGHCVSSQYDCDQYYWAFGYELRADGNLPKSIPREEVYECRRIIATSAHPDYAVLELDRASLRTPLTLASTSMKVKDSLVLIGHPDGLPLKVVAGGEVKKVKKNEYVTNLDAFHSNSGSPVLDEASGHVIGILVAGRADYVKDKGCLRVNRVSSQEEGEVVTAIGVLPLGKLRTVNRANSPW